MTTQRRRLPMGTIFLLGACILHFACAPEAATDTREAAEDPREKGAETMDGNRAGGSRGVVVYTALDQLYSEPILQDFEKKTGIEVEPVYDAEAAKTTGLVARLVAERDRPRCDVFWNNEIIRTIQLKKEGLLQPYAPPGAAAVPAAFKDSEGYWTGFAARMRVIAYNTGMVGTGGMRRPASQPLAPESLEDLADPRFQGNFAMAYPLFGTTATHGAILFARLGPEEAKARFQRLAANEVRIMEGNMSAAKAVAAGEIAVCTTDSDDACLLQSQDLPIDWLPIYHEPAAGDDGGALMIPNTLALIAGAPHPDEGRALIDYLLTPEVESRLAHSPSRQIPLLRTADAPTTDSLPDEVQTMMHTQRIDPNFAEAAGYLEESAEFFQSTFARP